MSPETEATARLLQTLLPLFPGCCVMVGITLMTNLLDLPSYMKVEQKLSPSPKQAGGRKQPPVDSVCVGGNHTTTTFNYHLCAPPPLAPASTGAPALACLELQFPRGTDYTYVCFWVVVIRLVVKNPRPVLSVARRE